MFLFVQDVTFVLAIPLFGLLHEFAHPLSSQYRALASPLTHPAAAMIFSVMATEMPDSKVSALMRE